MALLSGQRPAGEGLSGDRRITGQAIPLPKAITFSLTRDRVFGRIRLLRKIPRLRPACDPPLKGGFRVSRLATLLKPSSAFDSCAASPSSCPPPRPPTAPFKKLVHLLRAGLGCPGPAVAFLAQFQ